MSITAIKRFICLRCTIVILSTFGSTSLEKPQTEYNYTFPVRVVANCPMNMSDWQAAAERTGCNDTNAYHCAPDRFHLKLVEFCYYKTPNHVREGNCLELISYGVLNHVKCNNFTWGCPEKPYLSNEIYVYPVCLSLVAGCFISDVQCLRQKFEEQQRQLTAPITTMELQCPFNVFIILFVFSLLALIFFSGFYLWKHIQKKRGTRISGSGESDLAELNHTSLPYRPTVQYSHAPSEDTQVKTLFSESDSNIDGNIPLSRAQSSRHTINDLISISAIRQSITKGSQQSSAETARKQLGRRRFNPLHIAAKEGNLDEFKTTYEASDDITSTTTDGRNILHIAAYYGNCDICEYILIEKKELYDKTDNNQMYPAHWAALAGHVNILELMSSHGCDLAYKTRKYEENIVLFACMNTGLDVFRFVAKVENLSSLLHAKNREGWNSIQYAAKNGNLEAVEFLYENGVDIKNKSYKTGKNCLHTACEKGFNDVCAYILQKCPDLIQEEDKNNKHVGHFVAKSGNTKILEKLLKYTDKLFWKMATSDHVNVLHIACKYARLDMCIEFEKLDILDDLVLELTEKGWNAALFLTERAEDELKRIEILKLLDKHGLDVHHASRAGKTILYNACANQSTTLIEYLLQNYPDLLCLERSIDAQTATDSSKIKSLLEKYRQK